MKKEFTTSEVLKVLEIKRSKLMDWKRLPQMEFAKPSRTAGESEPGRDRDIFTFEDVLTIALFQRMVGAGVSRSFAGFTANYMKLRFQFMDRDQTKDPVNDRFCWLDVYDQKSTALCSRPESRRQAQEKYADAAIAVSINVAQLIRDVRAKVAAAQ